MAIPRSQAQCVAGGRRDDDKGHRHTKEGSQGADRLGRRVASAVPESQQLCPERVDRHGRRRQRTRRNRGRPEEAVHRDRADSDGREHARDSSDHHGDEGEAGQGGGQLPRDRVGSTEQIDRRHGQPAVRHECHDGPDRLGDAGHAKLGRAEQPRCEDARQEACGDPDQPDRCQEGDVSLESIRRRG